MPTLVTRARTASLEVTEYRCDCGPASRGFEEVHGRPCVSVVLSGNFTYRMEGRAHLLLPGSILLGNAEQEYVCTHEHGGRDRCLVFEVDPGTLEGLGAPCFPRPVLPRSPRVEATLAAGRQGLGWDELAQLVLAGVLHACGTAPAPRGPSRRADRDRVRDAALFLERHLTDDVGLEDAARVAGLSPWHFLRLFRRELGITPHQHLLRGRVARAARLLRETDWPVIQVGQAAGFGDPSNFHHTFRRLVGTTPARFRRQGLRR